MKENKKEKVDLDMAKALYVPYHPRARKLYRIFKKEFVIDTIFKKTDIGRYYFEERETDRTRQSSGLAPRSIGVRFHSFKRVWD